MDINKSTFPGMKLHIFLFFYYRQYGEIVYCIEVVRSQE